MSDFFESLKNQLETVKNERIVFWGASLFLEEFIKMNSLEKYNIVGIVDKDSKKWGTKIKEYEIFSPKSLIQLGKTCVISAIRNSYSKIYIEIKKEVDAYKIYNQELFLAPNLFETEKEDSYIHKLASNKIYLMDSKGFKHSVTHVEGLSVEWLSENSEIIIEGNPLPKFLNCKISCGKNCKVFIGSSEHTIRELFAVLPEKNTKLNIGKNFSSISVAIRIKEPDKEIEIGNNCMFSGEIQIRCEDSHVIFDETTKKVVNEAKSVKIGNHVWVGARVSILKGAEIMDNSIIGTMSLVNKPFDRPNVIIAGVPAKIIKENINWDKKNIAHYKKDMDLYELAYSKE